MNPGVKEDPAEWRKSTLLTAIGAAIFTSLLRWRHVLTLDFWLVVLGFLALVALAACIRPRWFRGFYCLSTRVGFWLAQWVARLVLALLFLFVITPLGLILRLLGKDPLCLKRSSGATSYWHAARPTSPLERLFLWLAFALVGIVPARAVTLRSDLGIPRAHERRAGSAIVGSAIGPGDSSAATGYFQFQGERGLCPVCADCQPRPR